MSKKTPSLSQEKANIRKSLEATARELNHIRCALDQSAIVAITDAKGRIIHVNDKFCEISEYSREDLLGKTHKIINSHYHSREFFQNMWSTISTGKIWQGEIRNRTKSGSFYWVNTTIVPFLDEFGRPYQYIAIRHEVTHQKQIQETIRNLLDATVEGILVYNEFGLIVETNQAAEFIFNYNSQTILNTPLTQYFDIQNQEQILNRKSYETIIQYEAIGLKKDGTRIHLEISDKPYIHEGKSVRLMTLRDVTSRKLMEAQLLMQDRLASIGLLASSLAHEIGTPLGVIRGRSEYLAIQTQDSPSIKKNVDIIVSQIDRVSQLIRSLLNLARGDQLRQAKEINLNQVASEVIDLLGHETRKHSIEVRNQLNAANPLMVKADAQPLHQVFLNLMVNSIHAIEYSIKQGQKKSHFIRIYFEETASHQIISIEDTGCGISEKNLKNLFKPFFTTKGIGSGTGLGLATSYRIVESWGGTIQVESQEGKGTAFHLILPK